MMHHQERAAEAYSLAVLYQKYAPGILSYLDRRLASKEDAEDLLLEVFLAALENQVWLTWTSGEQLAWLHRVAHNKLIDYYRHHQRHPVISLQETPEEYMPDQELVPEQLILRTEEHGRLHQEIAALPDLQQEILRLRFAQGLRTKEIARALKKTDTAIRVLLSRTLNQLRRAYDRQQGGM